MTTMRWSGAPQMRRLRRFSFGRATPTAFDILGRERFAVMPFDASAQREGQLGPVFAPRPAGGEVGHDRLQAVLRHILLVHYQIVEDARDRPIGRGGRL